MPSAANATCVVALGGQRGIGLADDDGDLRAGRRFGDGQVNDRDGGVMVDRQDAETGIVARVVFVLAERDAAASGALPRPVKRR